MRGLSFRQPWAHIVVHENKRNENRTWHTNVRGPFLVQASKGMTYKSFNNVVWYLREHIEDGIDIVQRLPHPKQLPKGGIVGVADLVGCRRSPADIRQCEEFEIPGGYVFELGEVAPLAFVECRGALGFWDVPEDVIAETGLGALRTFRPEWTGVRVSTREEDRRLNGLVEWRDEPAGSEYLWAYRLTPFGRKVRDALAGD